LSFSSAIREAFSAQPLRDEMRPTGALDQMAGAGLAAAAIFYLYFDVFGGMLRGTIGAMGLVPLLYLPAATALAALLANMLTRIGDPRTSIATICVVAFIVIELVVALLLGRQLGAALFEIYIWFPALVAMALTQRRMQDRFIDAMIPMFFIAVAGVLLNSVIQFPWADATYEVMGMQRDAARQWSAGGVSRLAGFSRVSYAASAQILIGFCALEYRLKSLLWRAVWWVIGLVAIHFTTSKSPEATMAMLPLTYLIIGRLRSTGAARRQLLANLFMLVWLLFVVAGPFISLTYGTQIYPEGTGVGRSYSSLADRVLNMWPQAIALIDWRNPVAWVVGRGLGGIGTPLAMFEPALANSADNIAIYLFVTFGIVSFVLFYLVFRGGQRAIASGDRGRRDFALIVAMLGIGSAANVIEGAVPIMILGLAMARYRSRPRSAGSASTPENSAGTRRRRSGRSQSGGATEPAGQGA